MADKPVVDLLARIHVALRKLKKKSGTLRKEDALKEVSKIMASLKSNVMRPNSQEEELLVEIKEALKEHGKTVSFKSKEAVLKGITKTLVAIEDSHPEASQKSLKSLQFLRDKVDEIRTDKHSITKPEMIEELLMALEETRINTMGARTGQD